MGGLEPLGFAFRFLVVEIREGAVFELLHVALAQIIARQDAIGVGAARHAQRRDLALAARPLGGIEPRFAQAVEAVGGLGDLRGVGFERARGGCGRCRCCCRSWR